MVNKKTKIYVILLIWSAIFVQLFINSSINRESVMVNEVMSNASESLSVGEVKAYAYYGDSHLEEEKQESIVRNIASKLGIVSDYEIVKAIDDNQSIISLKKDGLQGETCIRIISTRKDDGVDSNYITVEIRLKANNSEMVHQLKKDVVKVYEKLGMSANTNIYLCCQKKGKMTTEEINNEIDKFMEDMSAKEVKNVTFDDTVCVYGYSKNIDEYVCQEDNKVNVNIAFSYDEKEDVTYVHRAIPFIDKSF